MAVPATRAHSAKKSDRFMCNLRGKNKDSLWGSGLPQRTLLRVSQVGRVLRTLRQRWVSGEPLVSYGRMYTIEGRGYQVHTIFTGADPESAAPVDRKRVSHSESREDQGGSQTAGEDGLRVQTSRIGSDSAGCSALREFPGRWSEVRILTKAFA